MVVSRKVERDHWGGPASCPKCGGPIRRKDISTVTEEWEYERDIGCWHRVEESKVVNAIEYVFQCKSCGHRFTKGQVDRAEAKM